jgi:hypothetical protein
MNNRNMSSGATSSNSPAGDSGPAAAATTATMRPLGNIHHRTDSSSSKASSASSSLLSVRDVILLTPYRIEPGHTLITILRSSASEWRPEMRSNDAYVAEGDNAGIIINKAADITEYNKVQASQRERQQPPSAKMSFKVFLINSDTNKLTLEHRTLRFWLDQSPLVTPDQKLNSSSSGNNNNNNNGSHDASTNSIGEESFRSTRSYANLKQESSQLAQAYFCQLIGSKPDDFPKNYVGFIMKLMRLLKSAQFTRIVKMEVELRQLPQEDLQAKPPSPVCKYDKILLLATTAKEQPPQSTAPFFSWPHMPNALYSFLNVEY